MHWLRASPQCTEAFEGLTVRGERASIDCALSGSLASDGDDPVALFVNISQIYPLFLPVVFIS